MPRIPKSATGTYTRIRACAYILHHVPQSSTILCLQSNFCCLHLAYKVLSVCPRTKQKKARHLIIREACTRRYPRKIENPFDNIFSFIYIYIYLYIFQTISLICALASRSRLLFDFCRNAGVWHLLIAHPNSPLSSFSGIICCLSSSELFSQDWDFSISLFLRVLMKRGRLISSPRIHIVVVICVCLIRYRCAVGINRLYLLV